MKELEGSEEGIEMEAPSLESISLPSRGTGHCGITKKECEKEWGAFCNWQNRRGVL